jgi:DNA-binding protein HU-beta
VLKSRYIRSFCKPYYYSREGVPLNKNDLVAAVSDNSGLSKADSAKAVDGMIDAIASSLKSGTEVRLVGFGTFSVSRRAATTGRNPRTGETIQIKASNQPKFKAGKALKATVN